MAKSSSNTQEIPNEVVKEVLKQNKTKIRKIRPDHYLFKLTEKPEIKEDGFHVGGGFTVLAKVDTVLWAYKEDEESRDGDPVPYKLDEEIPFGHDYFQPRDIRYVPNVSTPFVDEQKGIREREPGQIHPILDNDKIAQELTFSHGELRVSGTKQNLVNYLRLTNQCRNQHPNARRFKQVNSTYELIDFSYIDEAKVKKGQLKETAYDTARTARLEEMLPHAKYLGIQMKTPDGVDRDTDSIRSDYKDKALSDSETFLNSFKNPKIKIISQIRTLVEKSEIVFRNGNAYWSKTDTTIKTLDPSKDPFENLAEFSLTEDGETFANNIRGVISNLER